MPLRTIRSGPFVPTAPRSGNLGDTAIFRKQNFITKGRDGVFYEECFEGVQSYSEDLTCTTLAGTIRINSGSTNVIGTGTAFLTACHLGQFIMIRNAGNTLSYLIVVKRIVSNTSMIMARPAPATAIGFTGYELPVLFPLNDQRGTLDRGNAIKLDKGSLLTVGKGVLRINGAVLPGASLTADRHPTLSLFDPTTGSYANFPLGMVTPAAPTLASIAGGTKGMQAGNYSIVITPHRKETGGFNNPTLRADVTLVAGDLIQITFPAMDTANGHNAWGVWGTLYADSLGADLNYLNGPWHFYIMVDDTMVSSAGGTFSVEWLDAEIERNNIVTFDNDEPVDAEFVVYINGVPVYISCQGQGNATNPDPTSPGPFILPAKFTNIEATPLTTAYSSSPPETILGVVTAQGKLYLLTPNHLQIALGTPQPDVPVLIRPFWKDGFSNPYQLIFINGTLYGYPSSGPSRSIAEGDEQSSEKSWAAFVAEITATWTSAHVLVAHDPLNNAVCFFHSADSLNSSGFWTTAVLMYGLAQEQWIAYVVLSSTTEDCIVSGVATIGDSLDILIGGRGAGAPVSHTKAYDKAAGVPVPWYFIPQLSDSGIEDRDKVLQGPRVTGRLTNANLKLYRYGATENIDVAAMEAGTGSATGPIAIPTTTQVVQSKRFAASVTKAALHTIRVAGTYSGSGPPDRLDECVYSWERQGIRR